MINLYLITLIKYLCLFYFLYFVGRSFLVLNSYIINNNFSIPKKLLYSKSNILYPIIGTLFVGNVLIILNFAFSLNNNVVYVILLFLLLPNFLYLKLKLNFLNTENIVNYLLIPGILIISVYNTGWHYDAGFYHLNHQAWLRESNLILGFVNIHWAFGMSSIFEYLSSVLWLRDSFIFLHFLNLIFIQGFYHTVVDNIKNSKNTLIINSSFFLLIFSILDNFGINGGRNGFIYIQGVTKQDTAVGILFLLTMRAALVHIYDKKISNYEISLIFLFSLYLIQIKLSSVSIIFLLIYLTIYIYRYTDIKFLNFLKINFLGIFFGVIWLIKQYLTTGCFIYPVNTTCINNFSWYAKNSTESYEAITVNSSYSLPLFDYNFIKWANNFISFKINNTVLVNFLGSLILLIIIKKLFFKNNELNKNFNRLIATLIIINILYLIYYGPTPRYLIGTILFSVSYIGFKASNFKFKLSNFLIYGISLISVLLLVRFTSYTSLLNQESFQLFDPRPIAKYISQDNGWLLPDVGDQCWINIECTMSKHQIDIKNTNYFKIASRS